MGCSLGSKERVYRQNSPSHDAFSNHNRSTSASPCFTTSSEAERHSGHLRCGELAPLPVEPGPCSTVPAGSKSDVELRSTRRRSHRDDHVGTVPQCWLQCCKGQGPNRRRSYRVLGVRSARVVGLARRRLIAARRFFLSELAERWHQGGRMDKEATTGFLPYTLVHDIHRQGNRRLLPVSMRFEPDGKRGVHLSEISPS